MKQHMQDNGIMESECELIDAAVHDRDGNVSFFIGRPSDWYGQRIWQLTFSDVLFLSSRLFRWTIRRTGLGAGFTGSITKLAVTLTALLGILNVHGLLVGLPEHGAPETLQLPKVYLKPLQ
jgi:hypothetical protein